MNIRQWLWRGRNIDREIRSLQDTQRKVHDGLTSITARLNGDTVSSTKDPHRFDKAAEIDNMIEQRVKELLEIKAEILAAIMKLNDYRYRMVLKDYYVDMMTLEQIAVNMHYSYQHIKRLRAQAIDALKHELE